MSRTNTTNAHIVEGYTLTTFAKKYEEVLLAEFVNKQTGEKFNKLAFKDKEGNFTYAQFGESLPGDFNPKRDLKDHLEDFKVLKMASDTKDEYFVLCKVENQWETIDLGL